MSVCIFVGIVIFIVSCFNHIIKIVVDFLFFCPGRNSMLKILGFYFQGMFQRSFSIYCKQSKRNV